MRVRLIRVPYDSGNRGDLDLAERSRQPVRSARRPHPARGAGCGAGPRGRGADLLRELGGLRSRGGPAGPRARGGAAA